MSPTKGDAIYATVSIINTIQTIYTIHQERTTITTSSIKVTEHFSLFLPLQSKTKKKDKKKKFL